MHSLIEEPFERESVKEELEELAPLWEQARAQGGILVSEYSQRGVPCLDGIEGVERVSFRQRSNSDLNYEWKCRFGEVRGIPDAPYGLAMLIPFPGAALPKELQEAGPWSAEEAVLDLSTRAVSIKSGETLITFPNVDVRDPGYRLLAAVNDELARSNAGVQIWKLSAVPGDPAVQHLYEDGAVPSVRNEHAQAAVTGYATSDVTWNAALVYVGAVAHKTALESLHATLLQEKSLSLDGHPVLPDSHIRMEVQPLPDFGLFHGALIADAALPGGWDPQDEKAYALVFREPGRGCENLDRRLEQAVMVRLREVLPHPVKDEWAHDLCLAATRRGLIDGLRTAGDCLAGARLHLDKDWTVLINDLLEEQTLKV